MLENNQLSQNALLCIVIVFADVLCRSQKKTIPLTCRFHCYILQSDPVVGAAVANKN